MTTANDTYLTLKFGRHTGTEYVNLGRYQLPPHTSYWVDENNLIHRWNYPAVINEMYQCWFYRGTIHRENDEPALIRADGTKEWFCHGKRHREGGKPAIEHANGTKEWFYYDKRHRGNNLPAIENYDGTKEWWIDGNQH